MLFKLWDAALTRGLRGSVGTPVKLTRAISSARSREERRIKGKVEYVEIPDWFESVILPLNNTTQEACTGEPHTTVKLDSSGVADLDQPHWGQTINQVATKSSSESRRSLSPFLFFHLTAY